MQRIQLEYMDARQATELLVNSAHGFKEVASKVEDYRLTLGRLIQVFEKAVVVN